MISYGEVHVHSNWHSLLVTVRKENLLKEKIRHLSNTILKCNIVTNEEVVDPGHMVYTACLHRPCTRLAGSKRQMTWTQYCGFAHPRLVDTDHGWGQKKENTAQIAGHSPVAIDSVPVKAGQGSCSKRDWLMIESDTYTETYYCCSFAHSKLPRIATAGSEPT